MAGRTTTATTAGDEAERILEQAQANLARRRREGGFGESDPAPLLRGPGYIATPSSEPAVVELVREKPDLDSTGYYDFDLAEFPWCVLSKSARPKGDSPLVHRSYYTNAETGEHVERTFETFPAPPPKGMTGPQFPGPTGFALTYALLQLYIEQGCTDDKIVFGSRRHLCRRMGINTSGTNIKRIGRELSILCGIRLRAENAYWDSRKRAYVHMDMWSPFAGSYYFTAKAGMGNQEELPLGFVQVHPQLQKIARTRGFFALGFPSSMFFDLTALEQRLAIFLSRRFRHHQLIRLDVEDVCTAMPIQASTPKARRLQLKRTFQSLLAKDFPLLKEARIRPSKGRYLAEFARKAKPKPEQPVGSFVANVPLHDHERRLVAQIVMATDDPGAHHWYSYCVSVLGYDVGQRALDNFRELYIQGNQEIRSTKGKAMTGVLKGIAAEMNIPLGKQ